MTVHQERLLKNVPIYKLQLVREKTVEYKNRIMITSPKQLYDFAWPFFEDSCVEKMVLVLLNTSNHVIGVSTISTGGLDSSIVEPRMIFKPAMDANAACFIITHNHPSNGLEPSKEDKLTTKKIAEAGHIMGIHMRDHVIVTDNGYTSMAERGFI
tara:strand:- start:7183 stop:7647 length:465 start_codon:yes stop_codon:yes gene_type:complete